MTQLVREANAGYHIGATYVCARNGNRYCNLNGLACNSITIGIEHGGFAAQASWPSAEIEASARLTCDITRDNGIPRDRYHVVGHGQLQPYNRTDPGANWPWASYLARVNAVCGGGGGGGGGVEPAPAPETVFRTLAGDFNGDGKDDVVTVSQDGKGGWADWFALELSSGNGFGSQAWKTETPMHMRRGDASKKYFSVVGDFDGNGKSDVVTISPNGGGGWAAWAAVDLSTGSGFDSGVWSTPTPNHMRNGGEADYRVLTGDFDGNGRTDLLTISKNAAGGWADWVAIDLTRAAGGFTSGVWAAATPGHMRRGGAGDYQLLTGDFNGDGKTDLATISKNGGGGWSDWVAVELSTGRGFVSQAWAAVTPRHLRNGGSANDYVFRTGDFNGDGKTDIATISKNGGGAWSDWVAMELSTGSGFRSTVWPATTPQHMRNGGSNNRYDVVTGDFNGDGKTDLATITKNGLHGWSDWVAMELSTGGGFSSTVWASVTPTHLRNGGNWNDYLTLPLDLNGDGKTDLTTLSRNGGGGWAAWMAVDLAGNGRFNSGAWPAVTPGHQRRGN